MNLFVTLSTTLLLLSTSLCEAQWIPPSQRSSTKGRYSFWGSETSTSNEEWVRQQMAQGIQLMEARRYRDAELLFTDLLDAQPKSAKLWNNLGVALKKQRKFSPAINAFNKAISIDNKLGAAYKNLGLAQEQVNNPEQAYWALQKYLEVSPGATDHSRVQAHLRWLWRK